MTPLLSCRDLVHRYARDRAPALDGVTLALGDGIVGLVGANGAGKSTLLRCIAGLERHSSGQLLVRGLPAQAYRLQHGIGSIPERPYFPSYLTAAEFLTGMRQRAGSPVATEPEHELADSLGLAEIASYRLDALSLGQSRRVELLAALIGDPDLVLLDEPTNGLDPIALAALRRGILASHRPGRLILVSSHHLDELQRIVQRVVLMSGGKVSAELDAAALGDGGDAIERHFLALETSRAR
ncbi:MAG: ABC transporter ATP-binding protein [Gemmatimonadaceae bacterium]|nr:ABC transporter ATP-binding protein [Gemmatimonadaceae bacterium]MCW5827440.1 ABC transporter ATP-binding protein [Gemmatimonadaceae bacterium]